MRYERRQVDNEESDDELEGNQSSTTSENGQND